MILRLVLWSLADSAATIDDLRAALREEIETEPPPGRLFGAWVSDDASERFGSISLWGSLEDSEQASSTRIRDLIGIDPQIIDHFDVEATASIESELSGLGLALDNR